MSRFNKNAKNLSKAQEREWLKANTVQAEEESKADAVATSATTEAPTKEPDEGTNEQAEDKPKRRRGLRRTKKGDNENG